MKNFRSCFFATLLCITTITAWGQAEDKVRSISTSGESSVLVAPDEAVIAFGTTTVAKELSEAKAKNDEATERLTSAVKTLGIEPRYFAMDNMQVAMRFDNDKFSGMQGTEHVGFEVSRQYMITLKGITKLQSAIDIVLTNGANTFDGVTLKSSELRKYRDDARTMAAKAAREKAVALAAALDCTVGQARTITETSNNWGAYRRDRGGMSMASNSHREVPSNVDPSIDGNPLGQIAITSSVNVTFDLIPGAAAK